MPDPITTDRPLTPTQEAILAVVLDQIIPADESRGKPSAAQVGVLDFLIERHEGEIQDIAHQLDLLNEQSLSLHQLPYNELTRSAQDAVLEMLRSENVRFLMTLAIRTAECYYLDARVMQAIGLPARPPFPEGYTVPRGDLSLLDPVRERGEIWRRADIEHNSEE